MKPLVKECIARIPAYKPGKPIEELERELGIAGAIKLASNENPLGPSPKAMDAIREALSGIHRYPDTHAFYLREKLARKLGFSPDSIIMGNGSDEIIHMIAQTFLLPDEEVIMGDPTFSFYRIVVAAAGATEVLVPLKNFSYDLSAMAGAVSERTKLIFINTPINPTGTIVQKDDFERFLGKLPEDVLLVMDEAYVEYVTDRAYPDTLHYVGPGKKVVVLRTFSKIYGLAGLRIGYGIADPYLIACLNKIRGPFNTNLLAQAAATAALDDDEHVQRSLAVNQEGLRYLRAELEKLGIDCLPTQANFFLARIGEAAGRCYQALLREGVIVRHMPGGILEEYLRITVGLPSENERLVRAMRKVMGAG
jgi:histidinol-phosphate aminotransferase